jgi:uncharacterized protein (TIGR03382 family)
VKRTVLTAAALVGCAAPARAPTRALSPPPAIAVQVAVGAHFTCARLDDGQVRCWGSNSRGQLGVGSERYHGWSEASMGEALPAVPLPGPAIDVAAGSEHACALLDDGAVHCWGANASGQLGLGHTERVGHTPASLESSAAVPLAVASRAIAAGDDFTCALGTDGGVRCWGSNGAGQLGLGHSRAIGTAPGEVAELGAVGLAGPAIALAAGDATVCAVLAGGDLTCWGRNGNGQLGTGNRVGLGERRDDVDADFPRMDLASRRVVEVDVGGGHVCARFDDGVLRCWGANGSGQLGLGDTADRGDDLYEMGAFLPPVDPGPCAAVTQVRAGVSSTCAVLDDGVVKCWGTGAYGILGVGDTAPRGGAPGEIGAALPIVALGEPALSVDVGEGHACAVGVSGHVRCWGLNNVGQLGLGHAEPRGGSPDHLPLRPVLLGGDEHDATVGSYADTWRSGDTACPQPDIPDPPDDDQVDLPGASDGDPATGVFVPRRCDCGHGGGPWWGLLGLVFARRRLRRRESTPI